MYDKDIVNENTIRYGRTMRSILSALTRSYVAIIDAGSITQAADNLGMAKSTISQNLRTLEEVLNVKLLHRTTRRLTLTPAGDRYYHRCKEILSLAETAALEIQDLDAAPSGPLVLTAPHAMVAQVIAPALASLTRRYPGLVPNLLAEDRRLDIIENGIDIAISVGNLPDSTYQAQCVGFLTDILCASPDLIARYEALRLKTIKPSDTDLPYIAHNRENSHILHLLRHLDNRAELSLKFQPSIFANTIEAVAALARQGHGIALLPDFVIADDLAQGRLLQLNSAYTFEPKPIYAVHGYGRMPPKAISEFITEIRSVFRGYTSGH